jgi:hypothetical protein
MNRAAGIPAVHGAEDAKATGIQQSHDLAAGLRDPLLSAMLSF